MKFNRVLFFVFAAIFSMLLTACGAAPLTNWPGIITDGKNVYMADGQYIRTIKVSDGTAITARTAVAGQVGSVFQAAGIALPPNLHERAA